MKIINIKRVTGAFALATAIIAAGAVGYAQHDGGFRNHRGGFGHIFGGLDLTAAQQEQLKQIAERYRQSRPQAGEGVERGRGYDALSGAPFDEAAVRAAAQARAARQVEREVAQARMMSEMYAVLTPEQKAKLAEARQQRQQRRQQLREQRRANNAAGNARSL